MEKKCTADRISEEEIKKYCKSKRIGNRIFCFNQTDSTNNEAKRHKEEAEGCVFIAEAQTAGRGRRGRSWFSDEKGGIWMSILLKPKIPAENISEITLVAGLAVCRVMESLLIDAGIKWPNDVVVKGKKVCGILTELSMDKDGTFAVILGMGINVGFEKFPEELKDMATSLYIEKGEKFNRCELIAHILYEFENMYYLFLEKGFKELQKAYKSRCVTLEKAVKVILPDCEFEAVATDINEKGELVVEKDNEKISLNSGEVSVRGIYGYI